MAFNYLHDELPGGVYGSGDQFYIRFFDTTSVVLGTSNAGVYGLSVAGSTGSVILGTINATTNVGVDSFYMGEQSLADIPVPVPEPGTIALAIAGLGTVLYRRRRNRK